MSDNQKFPNTNQNGKNPLENPPSIARPIVMWLILLVFLPALFYFSFRKSDIDKIDVLSVSEFETYLTAKRIIRAVVEEQSSSNIQRIKG